MQLTSTAFQEGQAVPAEYTADGRNVSPPLKWTDPPGGTRSLALICEDPDAPRKTWVHWVVFNVPAESRELAADVPHLPHLANGTLQGVNDFGNVGYGGPSPPPGKPHRYFFRLYALGRKLDVVPGASKPEVVRAMAGHVLAECHLMGAYGRTK
jgi:Raf kinase inhibitor-like YbhB/YbcL family protein